MVLVVYFYFPGEAGKKIPTTKPGLSTTEDAFEQRRPANALFSQSQRVHCIHPCDTRKGSNMA